MRQLREVTVKGVALVKRPANRRPIHLFKNQGGSVAGTSSNASADSAQTGGLSTVAPDSVIDAVRNISLSKGENEEASSALEGVAHLLANNPSLTLQDLMAVAKAANVADVAKAKGDDEDEDEDEDEEDEGEEKGEGKDPIDNLPPEIRAKAKKREEAKKSAGASQAEGAAMAADHSEQVTLNKAEHIAVLARLEKAEREYKKMQEVALLKSIKEENQAALATLSCDHDKLAEIVKSVRSESPKRADELMGILKGFETQHVAAQKSGSIYQGRAMPMAAAPSHPMSRFNQLVDQAIEKSAGKLDRRQAILQVSKTAEGNDCYVELQKGMN